MGEESKHKSKRDDESSKKKSHKEDRDRDRDHHHRDRKDREKRERSSDDKYEKSRRERERSSDEKHVERERDRDKRSSDEKHGEREREKRSSDDKHGERERDREKSRYERERSSDEKYSEREREREKRSSDEKRGEREREREKRSSDEKHSEREREKNQRSTDEKHRDRELERERERDKAKHKDRYSKDKDRVRARDDERPPRDKTKEREREARDDRERERKRERDREEEIERKRRKSEHKEKKSTSADVAALSEKEAKKSREEDLAEEQRKLDDEMEKRRRRVQEWQEQKRKREEKPGGEEEHVMGKTWTLEGESDDEDGNNAKTDMDIDADDEDGKNANGSDSNAVVENGDDEEIDPLDAFMNSMVLPEVEKLNNSVVENHDGERETKEEKPKMNGKKPMGRIIPGEDSDSDYGDVENDEEPLEEDEDDEEFMKRVKKTKAEKLTIVDHSKIDYPPFRKNFYIEVKEISRMSGEEVAAYRKQLELKIHGKDVPKPIKTWHQTGLSSKVLDTIKKMNFEKPMPIQAQALPVIMSGRDCIGIAKTGSGKTLAFVLPMLRHIKDQPPLMSGDGPIGLIMAPTRELVQQIHSDIKKFAKVMGLNCVPVYGGSGVAQQISELKRGAEIVVCTPGRMIDILCTSGGKITNLRRVTYLVMDEADRMFDMGFEPQITRIVQNTQPERQTVLFSATFPRQVEILARKVLNKPVEIQVGGRSVVNKDITQLVEVRPESDRFLRLLELLGEWYEKGKILIFVHSQEKCDALFRDLLKHGYPCLSLHGAKDQTDRESTISDFKSNVCNLLIATSVAARGLDVKELELVINYDVPNHYEDYVHRVGRTGRAGRKGCAITFISEDDARYAPDLVKALQLSEQVVPDDLKALANSFMAKVNQGLEQAHGTGYGGSGFKFTEEEDEARRAAKKEQARGHGFEVDKSDSDDDYDGIRKAGGDLSQQAGRAQNGGLPVINATAALPNVPIDPSAQRALAAALNLQHQIAKIHADALPEHYEAELEINDFPQNARWKVTHKETLGPLSDYTGAAITTRGQYFPPGKIPGPGDRKLYLFIEGPTESSVKKAKSELKRTLEEITMQGSSLPGSAQPGRYSVV